MGLAAIHTGPCTLQTIKTRWLCLQGNEKTRLYSGIAWWNKKSAFVAFCPYSGCVCIIFLYICCWVITNAWTGCLTFHIGFAGTFIPYSVDTVLTVYIWEARLLYGANSISWDICCREPAAIWLWSEKSNNDKAIVTDVMDEHSLRMFKLKHGICFGCNWITAASI